MNDHGRHGCREESFRSFFSTATGGFHPYEWQLMVALDGFRDVLPVLQWSTGEGEDAFVTTQQEGCW